MELDSDLLLNFIINVIRFVFVFFLHVQRFYCRTGQLALLPGVRYVGLGDTNVLVRIRVLAEYSQRCVLFHHFGTVTIALLRWRGIGLGLDCFKLFKAVCLKPNLVRVLTSDLLIHWTDWRCFLFLDASWFRPVNRLARRSHSSWQLVWRRKKRYVHFTRYVFTRRLVMRTLLQVWYLGYGTRTRPLAISSALW